ncbi:GNAT family N-acetyltransferase [Chryseobacterium nematophagum]|uniref:GNAT family N-acetyltransferase n=1 Tax=Chryseobacterium nematophagum TaxID=2305228 RepID=A0A3M7LB92_9FLAO|nr:GNAT family N-acetyltransferase [Chryseobacterium nematophagum]RMZ59260.1 GNAT family N-acetyltransferase [Chryseobacterium nematophagum]
MNLKLEYKKATKNDVDFLLKLRMKTMNEHYNNANLPTSREATLQRVLYEYDKANIITLNDKPIGLLKIDYSKDKIEILQLQIDPSQQGKGIGKTILNKILEKAISIQKPAILSVLKVNQAQDLYISLGFKIVDENEHSYIMEFSK